MTSSLHPDCNQKFIANLAQLPGPAALGTVGTFAEDFWFRSGFLPTTSVPDIPKQKKEILEITTMETILKSNFNNILNFNGC